jgi:anti-sigma factor RsiW
MDCKRDREEIAAYVDQELAGEARAAFESHLEGCVSCRAEVAAQQRLAQAFAALPEVTPPGDFEARFWARVAREQDAGARGWLRWFSWGRALGLAAVAAVALLLFLPLPERPIADRVLHGRAAITAKADPDVKIVSNPKDFELLKDPDIDAISEVDVLEDWDDNPPS